MRKTLKIVGILSLIVITALTVLGILVYDSQKQRCSELGAKHNSFPISQLRLSHIHVSGTDIKGRISNGSNQEIHGFLVEVAMEDCADQNCVVVGRHNYSVDSLVPAGEARDFFKQDLLDNQLASIQSRGEIRATTKIIGPIMAYEKQLLNCAGRF